MIRTIYALFVGIDDYAGGVNSLKGCVNDVTRLHDLLAARVSSGSDRFVPLLLTNAQATRQGIIDAWRSHLGQAGPDDVALFCYAGHGSQENAPPEFWDFEPDHLNETLVCHDSRAAGGWDLADKELAQLICRGGGQRPALRRDPRLLPLRLRHARRRGCHGAPAEGRRPHPSHRQLHRDAAAGGRAARPVAGRSQPGHAVGRHRLGPAHPAGRLPSRADCQGDRLPRPHRSGAPRRVLVLPARHLAAVRRAAELPRPVQARQRAGAAAGGRSASATGGQRAGRPGPTLPGRRHSGRAGRLHTEQGQGSGLDDRRRRGSRHPAAGGGRRVDATGLLPLRRRCRPACAAWRRPSARPV